jgi:AcrR family transcriptional regulator
MGARAEAAETTRRHVMDVARQLFATRDYDLVSLNQVAARASVGIQTVIRQFGSKEALFGAVGEVIAREVRQHRDQSVGADPAAAVDNLIAHYETHGRMVLHLLSQESRVDLLADVARSGRRYHRMWVERTFGRELTGTVPEKKRRLAQLVAITDLYVWKVLRLDCGLDVTATKTSVRQLVEAVIAGGMR